MIIVWQRWGILLLLTVPLGIFIGLGLKAILFPSGPSSLAIVTTGIGFLIAAAILWVVLFFVDGKVIDKPTPVVIQRQLAEPIRDEQGREQWIVWDHARDPATGQVITQRPKSSLFFIPMFVWPYIFGVVGVVILILGIVTLVGVGA